MSTQIWGEVIGTAMLILLGDGVCAAVNLKKSKAQNAGWIVIAFGWAAAVTLAVYMSGFMGPAHLNPAVTIAMAISGNFAWSQVVPFIIAQVLGAMIGALFVWLAYMPLWNETDDQAALLGTFATGPAVRNLPANTGTEAIGTFVLVFALLSMGMYDISAAAAAPIVGVIILSLGLSLGGPTGYALNPARDLGPRIMHQILPIKHKGSSDWNYAAVPIVGPIIGATIAAMIFGSLPL